MPKTVHFIDLGTNLNYEKVWEMQQDSQKDIVSSQNKTQSNSAGYLLLLEHTPVYTIGNTGDEKNLLISAESLEKIGASLVRTNRGGDITFHGPGQLVGYPILDLTLLKKDIGWYVRQLEQLLIDTLAQYGIVGMRSGGEVGVWLDVGKSNARKIAQIGVKISKWVTIHGFSLNANVDLDYFRHIIPCGIIGKPVTSMQQELGDEIDLSELKHKLTENFSRIFNTTIVNK